MTPKKNKYTVFHLNLPGRFWWHQVKPYLIPREREAQDDHTNGRTVDSTEKNLVRQQFPFENGPGLLLYGCSLGGKEDLWDRFSYLLAKALQMGKLPWHRWVEIGTGGPCQLEILRGGGHPAKVWTYGQNMGSLKLVRGKPMLVLCHAALWTLSR